MQFNFDCEEALDCDQNGISVLEGSCQNRIIPGYRLYVKEILDRMGQLSAKAQNLQNVITSTSRFFPSSHRLFIKADKNKVYGYLKVGPKKLFLRDRLFNYHERRTLSVLDFYVYDSVQRKGIGRELFDYMLKYEKRDPGTLAYDRPTLRLLSFLKKNYGLDNYITQNNSFIIFDDFFSPIPNYDTEFDNETHRVIQSLNTPQYLNTNNYSENNFKRYLSNSDLNNLKKSNNNSRYSLKVDLNSNQNDNETKAKDNILRNNNVYNKNYKENEKENNHPKAMSPIGKQLIYSNDFKNNTVNKNAPFNKNNINKDDSKEYNNIYANKNMNSINDYMSSKNQTPYYYNEDQNNINTNDPYKRINALHEKISDIKFNYRYQRDQLNNQENQDFYKSQDYINQKEYQNYQNNNRQRSPVYDNNYNNELARSQRINRNYYNRNTEYNDNYNIDNYNYYNRYDNY